ncbi:MAG: hypothetical protein Q9195_001539 [Heterodermia aff. obscurata]
MSGAESLAALGLASNILQFIEFTVDLYGRIRDYSTGPGMPRKLAVQADRLSDLLTLLRSLSESSRNDALEQSVVARCQAQAEDLELLLDSLKGSPKGQDRWWSNAKKALRSLSQTQKIEELQHVLDILLSTLSFHLQAEISADPGHSKSQIALEYAYQQRNISTGLSVFWIHATNTARFVESFKRIAHECKIPGRDNPELDMLQLVRNFLEDKYECKWLMIVDNVDDRNMFFEDHSYRDKSLSEYMPQTALGMILYTTRNRDIAIDLDHSRDPIDVPSMNVHDARSLLFRARGESTEADEIKLLEELVYLPLAITQAVGE